MVDLWLWHYYSSPKDSDLPKKLLQFCLETADGMSYLSKKCFVHRDLAARNILLDKEWHCKVCVCVFCMRLCMRYLLFIVCVYKCMCIYVW